ncbi:MAG: hypothetical protein ACJ73D_00600 [Pyrinomonadaceae bacterium]
MLYCILWYFVLYGIMPLFILGLTITIAIRDFTGIVDGSELIKNLLRKLF